MGNRKIKTVALPINTGHPEIMVDQKLWLTRNYDILLASCLPVVYHNIKVFFLSVCIYMDTGRGEVILKYAFIVLQRAWKEAYQKQ